MTKIDDLLEEIENAIRGMEGVVARQRVLADAIDRPDVDAVRVAVRS